MEGPCPQERFMATSSVTNCCICENAFGMMRWKYNCCYCGRVVCADCSPSAMFLPPVWVSAPARVCATCVPIAKERGGYFEGRSLGTPARAGEDESAEAMRAKMAAARLPSQQQQLRPGSVDPEKQMLLAQISKVLIDKGKKEPAGLRTMDNAKLQTYLDYLTGITTTTTAAPPASAAPVAAEQAPRQTEAALLREDESAAAMRAKMAAARLPSQQQEQRPGSVDPEKQMLLAQISKVLIEKGKKEPAGLRTMDNAKLHTYLDFLMDNTMLRPPTTTAAPAAPAEQPPRQEEAAPPTRQTSDPMENPMLAAALRRKAEADARSGGTAPVDPEKQAIIFQINKILKEKGKEEPFGLRSMDKVKLQSYLRHLRGE